MNLHKVIEKINAFDDFIPTDLEDRSTTVLLEEYCKRHPYFERTVRQINSMFRYIPFSEVLDTMTYLVNNEFRDIVINSLDNDNHKGFIFIYDGNMKSGFYFTLLFLKLLSEVLDTKYWDRIMLREYMHKDAQWDSSYQYVLVDDAAYSGHQMLSYAKVIPKPIVILIAASRNGYNLIGSVEGVRMMIGTVYPNTFEIETNEIFRDLDIFYERQGAIYSLLDETLGSGHEYDAVSGFYFQHKFPDYVSIPQTLVRFPDPPSVDRILTLEEKYQHLGLTPSTYVNKNDYKDFATETITFSLILTDNEDMEDPYQPFYKEREYTNILR